MVVEIDVPAEREAHHFFGFVGERKKSFAEPDGNDAIHVAVQDEQRRPDPPDALIGPEGILDEQAHGYERVG